MNGNRKTGGEIVYDLHQHSLRRAFAHVELAELKRIAQRLREELDWSFNRDKKEIYDATMSVIRVHDAKFDTEFIPAQ